MYISRSKADLCRSPKGKRFLRYSGAQPSKRKFKTLSGGYSTHPEDKGRREVSGSTRTGSVDY